MSAALVTTIDNVSKARAAWTAAGHDDAPDWVLALAEACNATSQKAVAARLGYSGSVVSQALACRYAGDIGTLTERVRGAYMQETVLCPVLGEVGRDRCLQEQREPFRATSSMRAQLYHACRNRCPHSKLGRGA
jgi:hypothetical protein